MVDNAFSKVKAALPAIADEILAEYGIRHHHEGTRLKGDWTTGYLCPLCGDKSGSASFTHQLYLKCHQCATKADVFDWLSKHTGKKPWELCKELAARLNVDLPKRAPRSAKGMPTRMTEAVLQAAIHDLWDHEDAEPARAILAERELADQLLLSELEVGWIRGWIIFTSRDERGNLLDRYRAWNPGNPKLKWMWFGQGTGGPGIWPSVPPSAGPSEKEGRVMLLEGESDVLTALVRLRLHEQGWHVCTWTAGATSCPQPKDVPRRLHGKDCYIGYDNDVFQGPDYPGYFVETKAGKDPNHARLAMEQRLRNLLQKVAPLFASLSCAVTIMQCPVDPKTKFGGDFRDWVNAGGRDLSDWKCFKFEDLPEYGKQIFDLPFSEVFGTLHKPVRTRVQVEAIARDDVTLSNLFEMKCEMGLHPACATCPGARQFPDGMIDMTGFQRELAVGLEQQNVAEKIIKDVVQRPRGCPRCEVVPVDVTNGSEWKGMQPGKVEDSTQRILHVFSSDPPSLSGEMEIEGIAYPNARGNGVVFLAEKVRHLDKAEVDLAPVMQELLQECPAFSDRIEDIDAYFDRRARDLAFNVTKIYGRRDIHIAHDLLSHSAHRAVIFGANQRAWLDVCVYGDTRTGKSLTFRRMIEFHGMGIHHTAVSNMSRAGLLMGAGKDGLCKPGVLPRCNKKLLMLDEFHFLVQNNVAEHPMSWMQSARDDGVASGVKIYGNRDLPAAVRLAIIANWMNNKRRVFQFDCEHLGALYGSPETLARLDFALAVNDKPTQNTLDAVEQFWTRDRTRALILRAWSQDPSQIIIDEDAADLAKELCREWQDHYDSEQLPLFTPEEKSHGLVRIAIAVANCVFSHPKNDPYSVHVRRVHVQWAANWLLHTWKLSGYDLYSQKRREAHKVVRIFEAERMFTFSLGLEDPEIALSKLEQFLTPFGAMETITLTGLELQQSHNWLSRMIALHVFERVREKNAYTVRYQLTAGGQQLVGNLMRLAEQDLAAWVERYRVIVGWHNAMPGQKKEDPDLIPMNAEAWEIFGGESQPAVPF
jgi:hypothetical protein